MYRCQRLKSPSSGRVLTNPKSKRAGALAWVQPLGNGDRVEDDHRTGRHEAVRHPLLRLEFRAAGGYQVFRGRWWGGQRASEHRFLDYQALGAQQAHRDSNRQE